MDKINKKLLLGVSVVVALLPLFVNSAYYYQILINIGSLTLVALGLGLLLGFAGQISFAQATFMGIGAYLTAIATVTWGWPPLAALFASAAITGVTAFLIGLPVLRFKTHVLALVTMGFSYMVFVLLMQQSEITGGPGGFPGIPAFSIGGLSLKGDVANYYLVWAFAIISITLVFNLLASRNGRALETLRSSEIAAKSLGVNTFLLKLKVFILSAVIASIGGSLYAFQTSYIAPTSFEVHYAITLLTVVVVGGLRSVWGSLVGAIVITLFEEGLTNLLPLIVPGSAGEYRLIIYGILLVMVLLFMPKGLAPYLSQWIRRITQRVGRRKLNTQDKG